METSTLLCWDCRMRDGSVGLFDRWILCRDCRARMVSGLPPSRPLTDAEMVEAILGGPGIRKPLH
jgi:hypothetical protein